MPNSNSRNHKDRSEWGVMEMARERPIAAAAAAAGAAAAGLFLWSKRNQISDQISVLSDQIGDWTNSMTSSGGSSSRTDDTTDLKTRGANLRSGAGPRSVSGKRPAGTRGRGSTSGRSRGTGKTGGASAIRRTDTGGLSSDNG
jgi:hypothetical protein